MQDCFRKYPEVYGAELEDEESEGGGEQAPAVDGAEAAAKAPSGSQDQVADISQPDSAANSAVDAPTSSQEKGEGQPVPSKPAAAEPKPTS